MTVKVRRERAAIKAEVDLKAQKPDWQILEDYPLAEELPELGVGLLQALELELSETIKHVKRGLRKYVNRVHGAMQCFHKPGDIYAAEGLLKKVQGELAIRLSEKALDSIKLGDKLYLLSTWRSGGGFVPLLQFKSWKAEFVSLPRDIRRMAEARVIEIQRDGTIIAQNVLSSQRYIGIRESRSSMRFVRQLKR